MASVSDYFRSMFTSGMKECTQSDIELKGVSARGLEKLIEIIYTSKTTFESHTDLFEVISSANHLQCLLVLDYCEKNFLSRLTCKNFNYFIQMAKMYRMQNALEKIDLFIVQNLAQIIQQKAQRKNKRFKLEYEDNEESDSSSGRSETNVTDLSRLENCLSYEQLSKCLAHDNLKLKEIDLFLLTWQWINETLFNKKLTKSKINLKQFLNAHVKLGENRFKTKIAIIRSLIKHIRFALITPNDLVRKVQTINKLMLNDKYLRKLLTNALNYHLVSSSTCVNKLNLNIRSPVSSVLVLGGREINPYPSMHDSCYVLSDLETNNINKPNNIRRISVTNLPNSLSHMQCVLVKNNFLYVIGGCLSQCAHGESAVNQAYRYDPRLNKWTNICSMLDKRAYFYACALIARGKEFIFSFGGKNRDGSLSSVEKYDLNSNTWSLGQAMPSAYYAHTGAVLNNLAYISGGYTHGHFTPDLHSFNPNTNQWEERRPMNVSRGWHSMCVANELLYVFGGCFLNSNQTQQQANQQQQIAQPITVTEYYSPVTDQWTVVRPMTNLHKEASCFRMNNFVYIFGGYNLATKTGQKLISKYDFVNDLWYTVGQLPTGMTGLGCCLLDLPWYLVETKELINEDANSILMTNSNCSINNSSSSNRSNLSSTSLIQKYQDESEQSDLDEDDLNSKATTASLSDENDEYSTHEDDDDEDYDYDDEENENQEKYMFMNNSS